jgi:hypothetical protein
MDMAIYDIQSNQWTTQFSLDSSETDTSNEADHRRIGIIVGVTASVAFLIIVGCIWCFLRRRKQKGKSQWSRVNNVNINNKPKRTSRRWSGLKPKNRRDPQEANNLQDQIFEQERKSQEKTMSRSNSEKSVGEQLLSPTTTESSDTVVALSMGDATQTPEEWLKRQREEVNQERQALAIMQMQQVEYARQMEALKTEI